MNFKLKFYLPAPLRKNNNTGNNNNDNNNKKNNNNNTIMMIIMIIIMITISPRPGNTGLMSSMEQSHPMGRAILFSLGWQSFQRWCLDKNTGVEAP